MKSVAVKKTPPAVDNLLILDTKRYQLIVKIQQFIKEDCTKCEVARRLGISRNTVSKYASGNPKDLSCYGIRQSKLDIYQATIVECLDTGYSKSKTIERITELGYEGGSTNVYDYLKKVEQATGKTFEPQPYMRSKTTALKNKAGSVGNKYDFITRNGVFRYLWMNGELTDEHQKYIFEQYPVLYRIKQCIEEFRNMFKNKNVPMLYLFIERYSNCEVKELASFANGLNKDIDAIENSVVYDLSNGFVEGTNSKLKMIKRTMYGRCKLNLLSAKMMLSPINSG